jgi:hypothetical protein
MGTAVKQSTRISACFFSMFFLSLASLAAAFALCLLGKDGAISFVISGTLFACLASVIGTTGKVTAETVSGMIKSVR